MPTLTRNERKKEIQFAYISVPNILGHYDACIASDAGPYIASPVPSTVDTSQYSVVNTSDEVIQTPSKANKYVSPNKKRLFQKWKATPENWGEKNQEKTAP